MQRQLLKIFAFIMVLSLASDIASGFWSGVNFSSVVEKKTNEKSKEIELEKEEGNEKILYSISDFYPSSIANNFPVRHTQFKFSAFLSLPELPPDLM